MRKGRAMQHPEDPMTATAPRNEIGSKEHSLAPLLLGYESYRVLPNSAVQPSSPSRMPPPKLIKNRSENEASQFQRLLDVKHLQNVENSNERKADFGENSSNPNKIFPEIGGLRSNR